jgi:hypothetical protein
MFVRFPPDARWNPQRSPVEFSIGIGEYEGVVRVPQRVFQHLLAETLHRNDAWKPTIFIGLGSNSSPERKVRRRLTDDGNVEITGRDLRSVRPHPQHAGSASAGLLDEGRATSSSGR